MLQNSTLKVSDFFDTSDMYFCAITRSNCTGKMILMEMVK